MSADADSLAAAARFAATPGPRYVVDTVAFQWHAPGIARIWTSLLAHLPADVASRILLLDRVPGKIAALFPNFARVPIAPLDYGDVDGDRARIRAICDAARCHAFASTYYTSASVPSVAVVYDMIPELTAQDPTTPWLVEKRRAISQARQHLCFSVYTLNLLMTHSPGISQPRCRVAYPGVDPATFAPRSDAEVDAARAAMGVPPGAAYYLLVGPLTSYRNATLALEAIGHLPGAVHLVHAGSDVRPTDDELRAYIDPARFHAAVVSDATLAALYSGARALLFPSIADGFCLPPVEAMACGCPVVACPLTAIPESAGDAAVYVRDRDAAAMARAVRRLDDPARRAQVVAAGLAQAARFRWDAVASAFAESLAEAAR